MKVIRDMKSLEEALTSYQIPITLTPPYFAESPHYRHITIISGDSNTFDGDIRKEGDNLWIKDNRSITRTVLRKGAKDELHALRDKFTESGFDHFIFLPSYIPGMVSWPYINNAFSFSHDAQGLPMLYFSKMTNTVRQPEPSIVEYLLRENHPEVLRYSSTDNILTRTGIQCKSTSHSIKISHAKMHNMEGKGDQLPMSLPVVENGRQSKDRFYHAIINTTGRRTNKKALEEYAKASGNIVIDIPIHGNNPVTAYHGNVAILYYQNLNGERGVLYCPDMLGAGPDSFMRHAFETFFGRNNVHPITQLKYPHVYEECTSNLSMNGVSTGFGRMISATKHRHTNALLQDLGMTILGVEMEYISRGGGGLQCCYTAINHTPLLLEKRQ